MQTKGDTGDALCVLHSRRCVGRTMLHSILHADVQGHARRLTESFNMTSSSSSSSSISSSSPSLLASLLRCLLPRAIARSRFFCARSRQRAWRRSFRKALRGGSSDDGAEVAWVELPCTKLSLECRRFPYAPDERRSTGELNAFALYCDRRRAEALAAGEEVGLARGDERRGACE